MWPDAMISVFWMLSFKTAFSLSSFTLIKRLFSSSLLSAIRQVSSAYQGLLMLVLYHKEAWVLKNWCFQIVVLEKTLESLLNSKEIKPVNPKGDKLWVFIGRTDTKAEAPVLWPPDMKSQFIGKDLVAGKDWGQEKGVTEDEMVGWHHRLNGYKFMRTPGDSEDRKS